MPKNMSFSSNYGKGLRAGQGTMGRSARNPDKGGVASMVRSQTPVQSGSSGRGSTSGVYVSGQNARGKSRPK